MVHCYIQETTSIIYIFFSDFWREHSVKVMILLVINTYKLYKIYQFREAWHIAPNKSFVDLKKHVTYLNLKQYR